MLADSLRTAILTDLLGGASAPQYSEFWVAVSSTDPGGDGSSITEPSGAGYARVQTLMSVWTQTNDSADNDSEIQFPESTGAWLAGADLTHFALYDAVAGNFVGKGLLPIARAVDAADIVLRFKAGDLSVQIAAPA